MKKISKLLLAVFSLILVSCASNIKTIKYSEADLSTFKSFACYASTASFKAEEFKTKSNKPIESSLIPLINSKMKEKGYSVNEKNPDLIIFLVNSNEINSNSGEETNNGGLFNLNQDNFPMPSGIVPGYGRVTNSNTNKVKDIPLTNGALIIEIFSRDTKELLWVGIAKDFKSHISDQTLMTRMINRVFEKFPN